MVKKLVAWITSDPDLFKCFKYVVYLLLMIGLFLFSLGIYPAAFGHKADIPFAVAGGVMLFIALAVWMLVSLEIERDALIEKNKPTKKYRRKRRAMTIWLRR